MERFYKSIPLQTKQPEKASTQDTDPLLRAPGHVDVVLRSTGDLGRWQIKIFVLMFILAVPCNWIEMGIELFGYDTEFTCKLPDSQEISDEHRQHQMTSDEICKIQARTKQHVCPYGYEYDLSEVGTTIVTEWNIVCDEKYLLSVTQTVVMFGNLLGAVVFGIAADKYGRRPVLIFSCITRLIFGLISVASINISMFIVFRFLASFFDGGIPGLAIAMCLEVIGGKWRIIFSVLIQMSFNVGFLLMALVGYYIKNWRTSQGILSGVTVVTIFCAWLAPESPRWNLAVGKKDVAIRELEKAAVENGKDPDIVKTLVDDYDDIDKEATTDACFFFNLFTISQLRKRVIIACLVGIIFFTNAYGNYQFFGEFAERPILNIAIQGATTTLGSIISALLVSKCSRRRILAATTFIIGLVSLLFFIPKEDIAQDVLTGILFCFIGIMTSITEPFIGELFPTVLRNSGLGVFSIFASFGAMIAPLVVSLEAVHVALPMALLTVLAFLNIIFILLLPEMQDHELDETVEDVEEK